MASLSEHEKRKVISDFYSSGQFANANQLFNKIKNIGVSRATVYNIWNRLVSQSSIDRAKGSGLKSGKLNATEIQKILKLASENGQKPSKIASKFNVSRRNIAYLLKKNNLQFYKKIDSPQSSEGQKERQTERLNILTNGVFRVGAYKHIIYDDESYFPLNNTHNGTDKGYYASKRGQEKENLVYKARAKFGAKLCVWIAISKKGHSQPFFIPAKCALNADSYSSECIRKRLFPFIQKNYQEKRYIFWPDGASCHYARTTIDTLNELGIKFIEKEQNPPNIPQLRPIERFWAHLKQKVYEGGWSASSYPSLKARINSKLKEFDQNYFARLCANDRNKIAKAAKHGVLSVLN
uniref:Tc1-like transposase DDE domain-containing protein n=1 Tax=Tetranychus urticae TaxID=32264 RepID=A0A158P527_TETUR